MINPTQAYITEILKPGQCPSAADIEALAYAVHNAQTAADASELAWLPVNFEDMGDAMSRAQDCNAPTPEDLRDYAKIRTEMAFEIPF